MDSPDEEIKKEIEKVIEWFEENKTNLYESMTYGCEYHPDSQRWDFLIALNGVGIPKYLPFYLTAKNAYSDWFPQIRDQLFPAITKAVRKEMGIE